MQIAFYWSDEYFSKIKHLAGKKLVSLNIANHIFTSDEMRSLRYAEVQLLPSCEVERIIARKLLDEFNKYGVVGMIKRAEQEKLND